MLSLNVRTPVHENNHTSHRVQDPSLIRIISQHIWRLKRSPKKTSSKILNVPDFVLRTSSSLLSERC